ncbi:MAG: MFS transporter [Alphaproteobacteria bacterium]
MPITNLSPFNRLFATASGVQAADQIAYAAIPITVVLALGGGPGLVGLLLAAQTAAWLIVSLPAGVIVDRLDRRAIFITALCLSLAASLAAALAAALGSVWLLGLAVFLGASGTVTFVLVQIGLVQTLIEGPELPRANARIELARATAICFAPFGVGWLATTVSPLAGYPLAAVFALVALGFGLTVPVPPRSGETKTQQSPLQAIVYGARFVLAEPLLRAIGLCAIFWNFAFVALAAAFVPFALSRLGTDVAGAGLVQGASGVGMILGALTAPALFARAQPRFFLVFGPIVSALAAFFLVIAPAGGGLPLAAVAYFLIGFGPMLWLVMQTSIRQLVTPGEVMGRVTATIQVAIYGVRPIGALIGGFVGQVYGVDAAMILVLSAFTASAAAALFSPLAQVREMPSRQSA